MRIIVFFDLPTISLEEKRVYRHFRKYLLRNGFLMMQESVYCKLALNPIVADAMIENIKKNKPETGLVQMLTITEKQFSKMEYVVGEKISSTVDSTERLIVV